jgi:hypothetical protein
MPSPRALLLATVLEDRTVPSSAPALGDPWPDPGNLTISFANDGSKAGNADSHLFDQLNKVAKQSDWEVQVLKAFQSWTAVSNLNFGLVKDGGQPFGTSGDIEGDPRFGDIRVGARLLSTDALANAVPFEWSAGTWSGDVLFNTGVNFGINPTQPGVYDLYTVALHEAGHTLGLAHSTDPASVMNENYSGIKTGLSASDVAAIQAIYGPRLPDQFEGPTGNGTWDTATPLTGTGNISITAALSSTGDVDYYRFLTPTTQDHGAVNLQTSGLSLLTAKVTVYDSSGNVVGSSLSTDPTNGDLQVKVDHMQRGAFYTVRVESARSDVFGIGRYSLSVVYQDTPNPPLPDPNDHGLNATPATATVQVPSSGNNGNGNGNGNGRGSDNDFAYTGSIANKTDVHYYRLTTPTTGGGSAMVIRVVGTGPQKVPPVVQVFDANMNPIATQVVGSTDGTITLQTTNIVRGQDYLIRIASDGTDAENGTYRLRVDFTSQLSDATAMFQDGVLIPSGPTATGKLTTTSSSLIQFTLNAVPANGATGATLTLTVTDSQGHPVAQVTQIPGQGPAVLGIYLPAGTYTVTLTLTVANGSTVPAVEYWLSGTVSSDPIGPLGTTTGTGPGTGGNGNGNSTPPTGTISGTGITYTPLVIGPTLVLPYSF